MIKFRGKAIDSGEWVYGGYGEDCITASSMIGSVCIIPPGCYAVEVDPETVGQLTGKVDSEGQDIWQGDIIKISRNGFKSQETDVVRFKNSSWFIDKGVFIGSQLLGQYNSECLKVIGNEHDNPELIGK